jgi:hypothetical protein
MRIGISLITPTGQAVMNRLQQAYISFFSGRLFQQNQTRRFNDTSYPAFLTTILLQTHQHRILIHDGARYHTSRPML